MQAVWAQLRAAWRCPHLEESPSVPCSSLIPAIRRSRSRDSFAESGQHIAVSARPGHFEIPAAHISSKEGEEPLQRRQELLVYVVGGIDAQCSTRIHELKRINNQINKARARGATHDYVGNAFAIECACARVSPSPRFIHHCRRWQRG